MRGEQKLIDSFIASLSVPLQAALKMISVANISMLLLLERFCLLSYLSIHLHNLLYHFKDFICQFLIMLLSKYALYTLFPVAGSTCIWKRGEKHLQHFFMILFTLLLQFVVNVVCNLKIGFHRMKFCISVLMSYFSFHRYTKYVQLKEYT